MQKQFDEIIKDLSDSNFREHLLILLDEVKNYIADARNEDWDVATRKASIGAIDKVLYNRIKIARDNTKHEPEEWL